MFHGATRIGGRKTSLKQSPFSITRTLLLIKNPGISPNPHLTAFITQKTLKTPELNNILPCTMLSVLSLHLCFWRQIPLFSVILKVMEMEMASIQEKVTPKLELCLPNASFCSNRSLILQTQLGFQAVFIYVIVLFVIIFLHSLSNPSI